MNIRQAIQAICNEVMEDTYAVAGTVVSVDQDPETLAYTCEVQPFDEDEAPYVDVRLQASPDNGLLMIPSEGSMVIIGLMNENTGYVAMYSKLDSIQFMDGSFGGLIKITDLVEKLNVLEDDLNNLKSAINGWTPVANDGGAALKSALATYLGNTITPTMETDIENDKVTHGTN